MTRISFIVPVYNKARYVGGLLESLVGQQGQFPYEILCINDGSTDHSRQVILSYAKHHSLIRLIDQDNQGPSAAINRGFEEAQGTYLWCVDADDQLHPQALGLMMQALEKSQKPLVVCDEQRFHTSVYTSCVQECSALAYTAPTLTPLGWSPREWGALNHMLFSRALLDRFKGSDARVFIQDYSFMLRAFLFFHGLRMNAPVYFYRTEQGDQLSSGRFQQHHDAILSEAFFIQDYGALVPLSFRRRCVWKSWNRLKRVARLHKKWRIYGQTFFAPLRGKGLTGDPKEVTQILWNLAHQYRMCADIRLTAAFKGLRPPTEQKPSMLPTRHGA